MGEYDYPVYINGKLKYRCLSHEDAQYCVSRWLAAYPNDKCEIFHEPFDLIDHKGTAGLETELLSLLESDR